MATLASAIPLSLSTGKAKNTILSLLNRSRNGKLPSATSVAAIMASVMVDERWLETEGLQKITAWLDKNTTKSDNEALDKWFRCKTRDKTKWTKALKNVSTLNTLLGKCQQDPVKPPFKVPDRITFIAFKEWVKAYFITEAKDATKKVQQTKNDADAAVALASVTVSCKNCMCSATITDTGRGLKNVKPCSSHQGEQPTSQLFPRDFHANFLPYCAHCIVTCQRCGCMGLRDRTFVAISDSCSVICRKAHQKQDVHFRLVRAVRTSNVNLIGGDKFDLARCCEQCDIERNVERRRRYQQNKENNATAAILANTTPNNNYSPLPPQYKYNSTFISQSDKNMAQHFVAWRQLDKTKKRTEMARLAIESSVLYDRAKYLMYTLFPKMHKEAQKT
jgi:hypothetical protein